MTKILNRQRPGSSSLILSLFALIFVVLIGWVLRYQVTMTTDLIPGINNNRTHSRTIKGFRISRNLFEESIWNHTYSRS